MANEYGDCFVVLKDCSENESVIFGRNSKLQSDQESVEVVYFPANDEPGATKCSEIDVENAPSFSIILERTVGVWGGNCGANEKGVVVGLYWSKNEGNTALLGTDLVRLGLERSTSASDAINVISGLNGIYGLPMFDKEANQICLIICDNQEAWLLNIVGKMWAAEQVSSGYIKSPHGISVTTKVDRSSENIHQKAQELGLWDGTGAFNFQDCFGSVATSDWAENAPSSESKFTLEQMFKTLRSSSNASSKSSHVSTLKSGMNCHWFTATPNPSESVFKPFVFTADAKISPLTAFDKNTKSELNSTLLHKYHKSRNWEKVGDLLKSLEETCINEMKQVLGFGCDPSEFDELMKDCVEAEVKFYR